VAEPVTPSAPPEAIVFDTEATWLRAEAVDEEADAGWVTGDFIVDRNKIEIKTRDVTQFSINVALLPIDWSRLVVLGINGRNSELRKRDFDIYHIAKDDKGMWVVLEP